MKNFNYKNIWKDIPKGLTGYELLPLFHNNILALKEYVEQKEADIEKETLEFLNKYLEEHKEELRGPEGKEGKEGPAGKQGPKGEDGQGITPENQELLNLVKDNREAIINAASKEYVHVKIGELVIRDAEGNGLAFQDATEAIQRNFSLIEKKQDIAFKTTNAGDSEYIGAGNIMLNKKKIISEGEDQEKYEPEQWGEHAPSGWTSRKIGNLKIKDGTKEIQLDSVTQGLNSFIEGIDELEEEFQRNYASKSDLDNMFKVQEFNVSPQIYGALTFEEKTLLKMNIVISPIKGQPKVLNLNTDNGVYWFLDDTGKLQKGEAIFGKNNITVYSNVLYYQWIQKVVVPRIPKSQRAAVLKAMEVDNNV